MQTLDALSLLLCMCSYIPCVDSGWTFSQQTKSVYPSCMHATQNIHSRMCIMYECVYACMGLWWTNEFSGEICTNSLCATVNIQAPAVEMLSMEIIRPVHVTGYAVERYIHIIQGHK